MKKTKKAGKGKLPADETGVIGREVISGFEVEGPLGSIERKNRKEDQGGGFSSFFNNRLDDESTGL
jgi:hypothetical protein